MIATPRRPAFVFVLAVTLSALIGPLLPSTAVADPIRQTTPLVAASNTVLDQFDQQMLDLMNGARATAGAPPLTAAPGLRALALGWSTFMADGGTGGALQHNPNVRAQLPSNGAASATAWAENVASWSPGTGRDAASVFGLYMNSPGHKANILNPAMRFVGIGTVINGANVGFNTQNFTNAIDRLPPPAATPEPAPLPSPSDGPGAASAAPGQIDVFARGADDALWTRHFDGSGWGGWSSLGGVLNSTPAAASANPNQLDVFVARPTTRCGPGTSTAPAGAAGRRWVASSQRGPAWSPAAMARSTSSSRGRIARSSGRATPVAPGPGGIPWVEGSPRPRRLPRRQLGLPRSSPAARTTPCGR